MIKAMIKDIASKKLSTSYNNLASEFNSAIPKNILCNTTKTGTATLEISSKIRNGRIILQIWINEIRRRTIPAYRIIIPGGLSDIPIIRPTVIAIIAKAINNKVIRRFSPINRSLK